MGAWGAGVFENDDACDYVSEVIGDRDLKRLHATLGRVANFGDEYLEAPEASEALAAADIVARLKGNWGQRDAYTAKLDTWVEQSRLSPGTDMIVAARNAVQRVVTEPSELMELWEEGDATEFRQAVDELASRLTVAEE